MANLANRFSLFDSEKPDKITRGACACNDDKVIFENPLNWTTRSFIFAKQSREKNEHRRELCRKTNSYALNHFEIFERHSPSPT